MVTMSSAPTNGKSTLGLVVSVIGVSFLIIGAIGGMAMAPLYQASSSHDGRLNKLENALNAHAALPSHPVMDARLAAEVKRLDDRISTNDILTGNTARDLNALENKFSSHESESRSKFTEVETQFDSESQLRNVQFSEIQRKTNVMWGHIPGLGTYPEAPYFQPNISNRHQEK